MKRPRAKAIIGGGVALSLAVLCMACTPGESATPQNATEANGATTAVQASYRPAKITGNKSWETWWSQYPDQVDSFFEGTDRVEGATMKTMSHAMIYKNFPNVGEVNHSGGMVRTMGNEVFYCTICHASLPAKIVEEEGIQGLLNHSFNEVEEDVDYFDCALCHEDGQPGGTLTMGSAAALFTGTELEDVDPGIAVCAQCHNEVSDRYPSSWQFPEMWDKLMSGEITVKDIDPYRYGTDPDAIAKAMAEDGYDPYGMARESAGEDYVNYLISESMGITLYTSNDPEYEMFMGSAHEQAGLTCVSCHMPKMTNEEGQTYTHHDASSTPLENDASLEFCLTCHSKDDKTVGHAETIDEMRQVILDAEQSVADLQNVFNGKRAEAFNAIAAAVNAGSTDEATLDKARTLYQRAVQYVEYATDQQGGTPNPAIPDGTANHVEVAGVFVAHNPDKVRSYIVDANAWCDEVVTLLS